MVTKALRMSVKELSETYLVPARSIRDRIRRHGFADRAVVRPGGVNEYDVTEDFKKKVLMMDSRYRNLVKKGQNTLRVPVKSVGIDGTDTDDVALTLVFRKTDVMKLVKFIRSFGGK